MDVERRRKQILHTLQNSKTPVSGDTLSKQMGVSRQIIVQDIAVLKAADYNILSTNRGYILFPVASVNPSRIFNVTHNRDQIREELYAIVDCGGFVKDVMVKHEVYGVLTGSLNLSSRRDVDAFMKKVESSNAVPLNVLSGDVHSHTVEADSEETLDEIEQRLDMLGFLIKK
ncbi:transcription repressor NadR [Konateibacter massiliensis]|uniref:transcription repressor NadR n=1 Tax=Konateibacter massiliensis TaxID=2002841 RepID=UPI000C15D669|nr:transcription repressor NadR [Konateibacter massiliensis]